MAARVPQEPQTQCVAGCSNFFSDSCLHSLAALNLMKERGSQIMHLKQAMRFEAIFFAGLSLGHEESKNISEQG